uniref:Uncharacterized protein n=1 Tax=Monopterus albus TaxID=43700 RepID=A0A3Q3JJP3_MONAL
ITYYCSIPLFINTKFNVKRGISYYCLQVKDPERCKQWLKFCNNSKYGKNVPVEKDYKPSWFWETMADPGRKNCYYTALKRGAVPSVFPRPSAEPECAPTTSVSYQRVRVY